MTLAGNRLLVRPQAEEFEISVFGPGFGECIVLHLGQNEWGIIDSCLDFHSKVPAALKYLESLETCIEKDIRFVMASHWHDDHIHGLKEVFKRTTSAGFVCTQAIFSSEFEEILSSWLGMRFLAGGSGVDEFHGIMEELNKRCKDTRFPTPKLAISNRIIWQRTGEIPVVIRALSPSDAAVLAALARFKELAPKDAKVRRRIPDVKPNDASIVVAVEVGSHKVLLGADLEVRADAGLGWKAIVNDFDEQSGKHHGFKIPHHGSINGHHQDVWDKMLVAQPCAVATPFINKKIPSKEDCKRILGRTANSYLTAPPQTGKFRDANSTVEKAVTEATISAHVVPGKYGHVRLRKNIRATPDSAWAVELFGNAISVADYVKRDNS